MNQTYELNNNIKSIIHFIKRHIYDTNNQSEEWIISDPKLEKPEFKDFINDIINNHSVYIDFVRMQIREWYRIVNESELDENKLNNFIIENGDRIRDDIINHASLMKRYIEIHEERELRKRQEFNKKRIDDARKVIDQFLTLKTKKSKNQFFNHTSLTVLSLNIEVMNDLWNEYETRWNKKSKKRPQPQPLTIDTPKSFEENLQYYIKLHPDEAAPLTRDQFIKMTRGWPQSLKSIDEWYQIYLENHPSNFSHEDTQSITTPFGFKSKKKIDALKSIYPNRISPSTHTTSTFPLKFNVKQYQRHKACPRYTYIIDLMFSDKFTYLVAINANTRYLFVEPMFNIIFKNNESDEVKRNTFSKSSKTAETYVKKLESLIISGMKVNYLQGDGEGAFNSRAAWDCYDRHGIKFTPAPRIKMGVYPEFMKKEQSKSKMDPMHSSLGIIDRVIRTIRDMAYNMHIGVIDPNAMKDIVYQYNNAPHTTLSKYLGMNVSPQMVQDDPELEDYIVRQINHENYKVTNKPGFMLHEGTPVKVYNEKDSLSKRRSIVQPGNHRIVNFKNGLYVVADDKNNTQLIPRYKITYDI